MDDTFTHYDPATGLVDYTGTQNPSTYVETGRVSTGYDAWGRVTSCTDGNGVLTSTTYVAPGANGAGQVASTGDAKSATVYSYDASGNTTRQVTTVGSRSFIYGATYNGLGDMVTQSLPGGVTQTVTLSREGQLASMGYTGTAADGSTVPALTWTLDSDALGRTTGVETNAAASVPAGAGADGADGIGRTLGYTYDNAGRLTDVVDARAGACQDRTYGFDQDGNRTSQTTTTATTVAGTTVAGGDCTVGQDGASADTTAKVTKSWTYDSADRITTGAAVHAVVTTTGQDGATSTATTDTGGATPYGYDALGRVTTLPAGDTPAAQQPEASGQPVTTGDVTLGYFDTDAARTTSSGGATTTYTLDPAGRRGTSTVTTNGADTVATVMDFGDDSDNPSYATQTVGANAPVVSVYGSSIGGDLGFSATGDTATLDLADPHGDTVTTMTIPTTGNLALLSSPVLVFDEYGNSCTDLTATDPDTGTLTDGATTTTAATGALSYGWLGAKQRATDTTGLTLMGARLYNPTTGQFTSTDPVPGGNTTPYTYHQDPINNFDLNGQWWGSGTWHHVTNGARSAWSRGRNYARRAWGWGVRHRGGLATVGASVGCAVPAVGWAACGALQAGALIVRSQQRAANHGGWRRTWRASAGDAALTFAGVGVLGSVGRLARYGGALGGAWRAGPARVALSRGESYALAAPSHIWSVANVWAGFKRRRSS